MFKMQWSDFFVPLSGPMGRKDYFIAFFKLGIAYFIGIQVVSLLLSFALEQDANTAFTNPFATNPVAKALTQIILLWSVLVLVYRRMLDAKQSVRTKFWAWQFIFPLALVALVGANLLSAFGFQRFLDAEFIRPLGPIVLFAIVAAGFLSPETSESGTARLPNLDEAETLAKLAKLAKTIAKKPVVISTPTPARAYTRDVSRAAEPALAGSGAVQRTSRLPVQGRVKSGWFN